MRVRHCEKVARQQYGPGQLMSAQGMEIPNGEAVLLHVPRVRDTVLNEMRRQCALFTLICQ